MNTPEEKLEQAFLQLPNLKHIGMALLHFARALRFNAELVNEGTNWAFRPDFSNCIRFAFPTDREGIQMYLDLDLSGVDEMDQRWLPLQPEHGCLVCKIERPNQLFQAAKYIHLAEDKFLTTRISPCPTSN